MNKEAKERRKTRRVALKVPVKVQGRDPSGATWEEGRGVIE